MEHPETDRERAERARRAFYNLSRKVLLAGIGAVVLAQDEMENFVTRLVDRGELAEADARRLVREMTDRRERMMAERRAASPAAASPSSAATRADVDNLLARIEELNRKIEELKGTSGPTGPGSLG